jgi:hypothetical protein
MKTIKLNVEKYFNIKYKISFVLLNYSLRVRRTKAGRIV